MGGTGEELWMKNVCKCKIPHISGQKLVGCTGTG